jgi:uncharacterized protein YbjQ (UPF0145 family)
MLLSTTETIAGKETHEVLGVVRGNSVRARHVGKDLRAAGRTLIGGEMTYYSELLEESRDEATKRMVEQARGLKADAIVNIRYHTAAVVQGSAEVLAYGTAVRLK